MKRREPVTFYIADKDTRQLHVLGSLEAETAQRLYPHAKWRKVRMRQVDTDEELEALAKELFTDDAMFNKAILYSPKL